MKPAAEQPEFDFEHELPAGKEWFGVRYLALTWGISDMTVKKLIEEGSLKVKTDLAPAASKHALDRVHRSSLVSFLNDRSNTAKWEALRAERRRRKQ